MKTGLIIFFYLLLTSICVAQQDLLSYAAFYQQLEVLAEKGGPENEDDMFLQQMEYFKKHPLNLNTADAQEMKKLLMLTDFHINHLINYRRIFGKLLHVYELQAVPSWDIKTILGLLPFITINDTELLAHSIKNRWSGGEHTLLANAGQVLERSKGYLPDSSGDSPYPGNRNRLYLRYRYKYKNYLQWGILGDKDPGEQFFSGKQKGGFDFYSYHFFTTNIGMIKSLAIGDFTANMGQGLIQWQSLAFKKSAELTSVKRRSPVLNPYTSAGESNFLRGMGITMQKAKWETTLFVSSQKISANLGLDSANDAGHLTSLLSSGYHRTSLELADKKNVSQLAAGATIKFSSDYWHFSMNGVYYRFSHPIQKQDKPYNLFALKGNKFTNLSIDYSYSYRNIHLFGECAIDKNRNNAFLHGLLIALAPVVDASLVHRYISKSYQAVYANAFTENTVPSNENGIFGSIAIRPSSFIQIQAYADLFKFPWLRYRVDAPSWGKEYFIAFTYTPNKKVQISSRYRAENKQGNRPLNTLTMPVVENIARRNWRIHTEVGATPAITIRNRCEMSWYHANGINPEEGFMAFTDFLYRPPLKSWSGNFRLMYFETEGYNSRVYAYENDVMYSFSVPASFDRGWRYYLNIHLNITALKEKYKTNRIETNCWIRVAQTIYFEKDEIGSGAEIINGNKRTEIKLQLMFNLSNKQ